ncbi:MAG: hypothetical protein WC942_08175 [Clostridia bacterium]|jgi:hypothetical protein
MATNLDTTTKKLLKQFSILPQRKDSTRTVVPAKVDRETGNLRPIQMDTDIQRHFREWTNDLTNSQELKNRFARYKDLDFMVQNNGWINLAAKLYANETISPDESGKILNVYAKDKKVEKYINEFIEKIGINRSLLENIAYDLATKADSFLVRSIDNKDGIVEVTPITPYDVSGRFEFCSIEEFKKESKTYQYANNDSVSLSDLENLLTDKIKNKDYAANYKRYLFGFGLSENKILLPPWAVSHFRRFSTQSEFAPFGRPLLINSLSLFREYLSSKNLMSIARVASFPKEIFKVKVDDSMTPVEKIIAVNEARQEYYNFVNLMNGKEENAIGQAVWTATETFEYEIQSNNIDLGDIADIELIKDELIASTLIPKGYLIASEGWGESGRALLQQSKIFAREVYSLQTAVLEALYDLIRTQFVLMDLYDGYETEFELSLSFPSSEQSKDNIDIQKDTMDLAQAVIDNLKTALAIDSIPPNVVKSILHKYAGFDSKELDSWLKDIETNVNLEITQPDYNDQPQYMEKLNKAMNRLSENIFREAYFNAKNDLSLNEGVINNKHFYRSRNLSSDEILRYEWMKEAVKVEKEENKKLIG